MSDERRFALDAVAEACELASRVQSDVVAQRDAATKGDRSPVTMADLAIQAVFGLRLARAFPGTPLLAEEEASSFLADADMTAKVTSLVRTAVPEASVDDIARALDAGRHDGDAERYWVMDPVDGTKGFLRGDQYAVALALVERGEVVLGVLGCPNLGPADDPTATAGSLFVAVRGEGAFERRVDDATERPIRVDAIDDPRRAVMCESVESAHAAHSEHARIAEGLGITAEPYRIDSQCKYAVLSRGQASVYLRLPRAKAYREKVWDHAAGAIVISEAGGRVSDLNGNPLDFTRGRMLGGPGQGIIATNGRLHDRVLEIARAVTGWQG
jgi:HAL2 family 3'(2'),5'-bisphosphate nucleotidase